MISTHLYEFGAFRLDTASRLLLRDGTTVPLPPKVVQTLIVLVENRDRLLAKQELLRAVWGDTFVEENSLTHNISVLRKVLGEAPDGQPYIETVPRRGYRFRAPVSVLAPAATVPPQEPGAPARRTPRSLMIGIGAAAAAAVLLVAVPLVRTFRDRSTPGPVEVRPFTTDLGAEMFPAFSPDGKQIAYTRTDPANGQVDLYRRVEAEPTARRLTNSPATECYPRWSPDGSKIAFVHCDGGLGYIESTAELFVLNTGSGERQRVAELITPVNGTLHLLAWFPDGRALIVRDRTPDGKHQALFRVEIDTGSKRQITYPNGDRNDAVPAVSADGRKLAFVRATPAGAGDVFVQDLSGRASAALRMTRHSAHIAEMVWPASDRWLYYLVESGARRTLWRVASDGGTSEPVHAVTQLGDNFTLADNARRIAYTDAYADADIVRVALQRRSGSAAQTLIASTRHDANPQYSPDGSRIAFASDRTGQMEIWLARADGADPIQLTRWKRLTGTPRWSPDGSQIAVDSRTGENTDIHVIRLTDGQSRRITTHAANDFVPSWSGDGKWIYFTSNRTGQNQIWKIPSEGSEMTMTAVQVTASGGLAAREGPEGKLYYAKRHGRPYEIWCVPAAGGPERRVAGPLGGWMYLAVFRDGLYYSPLRERREPRSIVFHQFGSEQTKPVTTVDELGAGFAISPDRRWLLYAPTAPRQGDIFIVEVAR